MMGVIMPLRIWASGDVDVWKNIFGISVPINTVCVIMFVKLSANRSRTLYSKCLRQFVSRNALKVGAIACLAACYTPASHLRPLALCLAVCVGIVMLIQQNTQAMLAKAKATMDLFHNLPGFILVTTDMESHLDVEGDVLGVTGYTADEFVALDPMRDFLSPKADRAQVSSSFESMIDPSQHFVEVDIPYIHKDGHTIWLRARHGSRVVGTAPNGKPKVVAVFSDVTATVTAQREVKAVSAALARRVDLFPAMLYEMVADETGRRRFVYANSKVTSVCGLTPTELTSSSKWMDMIHPDDVERYESSIAESQASMKQCELEFRIVVEGETKYLHGRAVPRQEGGKVVWTGVLQDATVNHNLREMTKKRNKQTHIAKQSKAACAFLSHEIRNQLYPQSLVLEDMKDGESRLTDSVDMILNANTTVTTILNRVLDLAKWESGQFPVDMALFPITRLFKSIASYAKAKRATVEGLASIQPTWYATADEHLLKQAATNLVSNAAKFGESRPLTVTMAFEQMASNEGVLVVTVTDKGRGMAPDELAKVMLPFGQIRKAGEARSGTGLGLPLTKAMVEVGHGGTLVLASEGLGKGTTATMRVPVMWMDENKAPRPELDDPLWWVAPHPGATADILVVDDVLMNRMVTIFGANKLGLTVHEAENGEEAVELMRKNTYSIVFMDNQMPVMNGDIATEQARENGYSLPIVMVSGESFDHCKQMELKRRGVTEFIGKMAVPGPRHAMKRLRESKDNMCI